MPDAAATQTVVLPGARRLMELSHGILQLKYLNGMFDSTPMNELPVIATGTTLIRLARGFENRVVPVPADQILGRSVGRDIVDS